MPGAWEVGSKSVLCGILTVETVPTAWAFGFRKLIIPGPAIPVSGMPFDHARNVICQQALDGGFTHVFHLDSDVIPPNDAVMRLLAHNKPIVSGMYSRRSKPHGIPVMLKGGQWLTQFPMGQTIEVDLVGAGCLLIETDLLRQLPPIAPQKGKQWFDWRVDMASLLPQGEALSEDFSFCRWAQKHGHKIWVDTSIECRHAGLAQATYGKIEPLEMIA